MNRRQARKWIIDNLTKDLDRYQHLTAPEDAEVLPLCQRWGYGAVMDSAARLWAHFDKTGARVVGPSRMFVEDAIRREQ